MITRSLRRALATVATITLLTLPAVSSAATAMPPDADDPTPPQPSATEPEPVFDDGTWTIETMLAARHAQLTTIWWASLF